MFFPFSLALLSVGVLMLVLPKRYVGQFVILALSWSLINDVFFIGNFVVLLYVVAHSDVSGGLFSLLGLALGCFIFAGLSACQALFSAWVLARRPTIRRTIPESMRAGAGAGILGLLIFWLLPGTALVLWFSSRIPWYQKNLSAFNGSCFLVLLVSWAAPIAATLGGVICGSVHRRLARHEG